MLSVIVGLGRGIPSEFGLILTIAALIAALEMWLQEGALKEPGHDRDKLLQSLELGGELRKHYIYCLTGALNYVDSLLGDRNEAIFSISSPFKNKILAPYWTGWSFDTCAFFSVIYPFAALFLTWVWTGHAGVIGQVIGLIPFPDAPSPAWIRGLALAAFILAAIVVWLGRLSGNYDTKLVLLIATLSLYGSDGIYEVSGYKLPQSVAFPILGAALSGGILGWFAAQMTKSSRSRVFTGVSVCALMWPVILAASMVDIWAPFILVIVTALAVNCTQRLAQTASRARRLGLLWTILWPVFVCICFSLFWIIPNAVAVKGDQYWEESQYCITVLLMVSFIPLINMPFDWISIGITRALLRLGCEDDGPSPFTLGFLDLMIGLFLLIPLTISVDAALSFADWMTVQGAGIQLIPVQPILEDILTYPTNPDFYWVYITLLSTMIPSIINCCIGSISIVTWSLPRTRFWMLKVIPNLDQQGWETTRRRVLALLGLQVFLGVSMAGATLWTLAVCLIYLEPMVIPQVMKMNADFAFFLLDVLKLFGVGGGSGD